MAKEEEKQEQEIQELEAVGFTEAPASINVKFLWQGFDTMLTIRDDKVNAALAKYRVAIEYLEKMGAAPTPQRYGNANANAQQAGGNGGEAPLCPTHGKPMLPSKHGEGFYCPVKIAEDDGTGKPVYCKQRVK